MQIRKGVFASSPAAHSHAPRLPIFYFLFSIFVLYGCAAPGEPIERKPPTPSPVTDLAASQSGNDVVLTFTLPRDSVEKREILKPISVNVYRNFEPIAPANSQAAAAPANPTLLLTIPPAMVDRFMVQGRVRFVDSLRAEDFSAGGSQAVYLVRTFVSPKKLSASSNVAALAVYPAANPIADLKADFKRAGVTLSWTPPEKTLIGAAPNIAFYRVYRAETESAQIVGANSTAAGGTEAPNTKVPSARIAEAASPPYTDTQTELGKTYMYSVRSIAQYPGVQIESRDSNFATITPHDVFPPPAPQDLVVAFVPALGGTPGYLDLSWSISAATDIAGYNVYRSDDPARPGTRLNPELLLTPAFRDMNAAPGRTYFYTVTAVDRSGNESPASPPASGSVPEPDQQ
ncbi:MAG: fibronectin type III domain-containing protein [Candidatus Acidiferrales bacterium]